MGKQQLRKRQENVVVTHHVLTRVFVTATVLKHWFSPTHKRVELQKGVSETFRIPPQNLFIIRQHFCCLKCSNMLRDKAWADFQGGSCCLRLSITWILLLFSPADSPTPPSLFALPGVICAGEELGERAAETSQSQHCNSSGREQG